MKKKYALGLVILLMIALFGLIHSYRTEKKTLKYIKAIDEVYDRSIDGMSVVVGKTSSLNVSSNGVLINSAVGNKENNFSENSKDGVILWEVKQLFLNIKNLKVLREGLPETLEPQKGQYYLIQTSQDFYGQKTIGLYHLTLFINPKDYHVFIPVDYDESNDILTKPTIYAEYETNEITKKLINDIIKQ